MRCELGGLLSSGRLRIIHEEWCCRRARNYNADYRVIEYLGAVHAFTNPEATEAGQKFTCRSGTMRRRTREATAEALKFFVANLPK